MKKNSGFGKTILFGEHFAVYELPAIVAALDHETIAKVEKIGTNKRELHDQRKWAPGVLATKKTEYQKLLGNILDFTQIKTGVRVTLDGNLIVMHGGIGASASASVAVARALNSEFNLNLADEAIHEAALCGELAIHGNPSGIDTTAALWGGIFEFKKNSCGPNNIRKINVTNPIEIVLANSGKTTNTKIVIDEVKKFFELFPEKKDLIFADYLEVERLAFDAFSNLNLATLGQLMDENHVLLQQIGVSCPELDYMVGLAKMAGALGAKLTGTGKGGLMVALTPGKDLQEKVATELELRGYFTLKTSIKSAGC